MKPTTSIQRVTILGAGVVGLCLARRLALLGRDVVVVDARRVGSGASGASAGILTAPAAPRSAFQRRAAASFEGYRRFLDELDAEAACPIELDTSGMAYLAECEAEAADMRGRAARLAAEGVAVEWLERSTLRKRAPALARSLGGALWFTRTSRVHPPDLLAALAESSHSLGVRLVESPERVALRREPSGLAVDLVLEGGVEETLAGALPVLCAGAWTTELAASIGLELEAPVVPVRGQMLEIDCGLELPFMLDVGEVYILPRPGGRVWVGATVEEVGFDEGVTLDGKRFLLAEARRALPGLRDDDVVRHWAGLRPKALRRGGPIVTAGEAWVLAGHYRSGILSAPRDADVVAARLTGVPLASFSPFAPVDGG